jgi:subtilisin family serine protease
MEYRKSTGTASRPGKRGKIEMSRKPVHATWLVISALAAIMTGACLEIAHAAGNGRVPVAPPAGRSAERQAALAAAIRTQVPAFAPDRVLVRFRPGTAALDAGKAHRQAGGRVLREISAIGVQVIEVPRGKVNEKVAQYARNPNVLYAEPDYYRVLVIPDEGNDPGPSAGGLITGREYFEEQWGLNNTGQDHTSSDPLLGTPIQVSGVADADIDAPEGWDITTGDPSVRIAILDTGIDCDSIEHAGKCVEDISFVEDYSEYLDDPEDYVGHGTHVAGIAAVHTNNGIGVAGVGWNSSLGNLKTCFAYQIDLYPPLGIYVTTGVCPVSSSAAAITHAADDGYHVINMSYGSDLVDANGDPAGIPAQPNTETTAISYAWSQGVVLVAAAGNDNNSTRVYPAANDDVIAVGATDHFDNLASFSSFSVPGDHWVSLLAPGVDILSTTPVADCVFFADLLGYPFDPLTEGCLTWNSGTSMASPHVAGTAALVWAHLFPGQSPQGCTSPSGVPCNAVVRSHLEYGTDSSGALTQNFQAWSQHGRLNVQGALSVVDTDLDGLPNAVDDDDDNDGLSDSFEINYDPLPPDTYTPGQDLDPLSADTDSDGLDDGDEIAFGSDPLTADTADGDVNLDGTVNAADVLLATRSLTGALVLNVVQLLHADMVNDDILNAGDLLLIQQAALGN